MSAAEKLVALAELGFEFAGESVPLGFDFGLIESTISKLPNGLNDELKSLFAVVWPGDFFLGAIEFMGPDRINFEHEELYPGLTTIRHGFIGFGSDGAGTIYTYCNEDRRVYLLPSDNFSDDGLWSNDWELIETNPATIKSIAVQSWDSVEDLMDWGMDALCKYIKEQESEPIPDRDSIGVAYSILVAVGSRLWGR